MPGKLSLNITGYIPGYNDQIADLFTRAVHAIGDHQYNPAQKEVWAPRPPDFEKWAARLAAKKPFLAFVGHQLAGFIELEANGHIDCAYVAPEVQRLGVGNALYRHLEEQARGRGIARLFVEASLPALSFFEKLGFTLVGENRVERAGQILTNYSMEKFLT